jgi:glycosyltransferase involved in cell wall biosynthesis
MLKDRIVVNVDDLRNTDRDAVLAEDTHYIPSKMSRLGRFMRTMRLTTQSDSKLRSEWMLQTIRESGASLVFVHFLDFAVRFRDVWDRLDVPVVVHCHGYDIMWDVRDQQKKTPLHPPNYQANVRSLPENVWFIANSNHTKRQLLKLDLNPEKIFLKRFGVPLAKQPRSMMHDASAQVLFLGRLVDFKGPVETARAFGKVVADHSDSMLHFAGSGNLAQSLAQTIAELGLQSNTVCHGVVSQDQGRKLRRQSCIFTAHNQTGVTTRQVEAFGVSMLEAMGEGIPVVTGRSGGISDFIEHGTNGLLFEPGDVQAHAEMLDELLSSKQRRQMLGTAAWETVRDRYQPEHESEDLDRIFSTISDQKERPTLTALQDSRLATRAA